MFILFILLLSITVFEVLLYEQSKQSNNIYNSLNKSVTEINLQHKNYSKQFTDTIKNKIKYYDIDTNKFFNILNDIKPMDKLISTANQESLNMGKLSVKNIDTKQPIIICISYKVPVDKLKSFVPNIYNNNLVLYFIHNDTLDIVYFINNIRKICNLFVYSELYFFIDKIIDINNANTFELIKDDEDLVKKYSMFKIPNDITITLK